MPGTYRISGWEGIPSSEYQAWAAGLRRIAARVYAGVVELECTIPDYPGRDTDEALMAEVLAKEDV